MVSQAQLRGLVAAGLVDQAWGKGLSTVPARLAPLGLELGLAQKMLCVGIQLVALAAATGALVQRMVVHKGYAECDAAGGRWSVLTADAQPGADGVLCAKAGLAEALHHAVDLPTFRCGGKCRIGPETALPFDIRGLLVAGAAQP